MGLTTNDAVAARWVQGLAGDFSILESLSSPTMRIWHSHDDRWLTREEGRARMDATGGANTPELHDLRTTTTENGFIVQGWIEGLGAGKTHIVQVNTVENGNVASCEEYIAPEMELG